MNQIKAVVTRKNADYLQIHSSGNLMPFQFLTKVMAVCGDFKTPIHLISSSSVNISMAVELSSETFHQMENQLSQFASVSVEKTFPSSISSASSTKKRKTWKSKSSTCLKTSPS